MLGTLNEAKKAGNYLKLLTKLYKTDLLILEDFGLNTFDHERQERHSIDNTRIPSYY
jgi:DNA replication protein DnaC